MFKIGDRVIGRFSSGYTVHGEIIDISTSILSSLPINTTYIVICFNCKYYFIYEELELDKEYIRDIKLKELLHGS